MSATPRIEIELPPAEGMFRELLWIHGMIRRDLETIRDLAQRVRDGAPAADVGETIRGLQTEGPLWKLRANCLYYCRVVHAHHTIEDVHLFPAIRRSDPSLDTVVDRLEADHLRISDHLDAVEAATRALGREDDAANRERLVAALDELADHLLAHLTFEETSIGPTLSQWRSWPVS
jgi:hypothetical protein